jgi:pimeloyl-ACP methyl ester carboxylesterase
VATAVAVALAACRSDRSPNGVGSGAYAVAGGTLYYERIGSGPPVVLIHGGNLDRRMWDPQFFLLGRTHTAIRYDVRGFGRSSPADRPYQSHEDLAALLDSLGVAKASIVGLSLGGRIAIDFALSHPTRVDRLVLAGPGLSGWRDWAAPDSAWRDSLALAARAGDSVGIVRAWLQSDYMKPAMGHPNLAPILERLSLENASAWMGSIRSGGDPEREADPPAIDRLGGIQAPTLIILGDRDSPPILKIVGWLGRHVPGARTEILAGAGHMVNLERPDRFNELMIGFLSPEDSSRR